MNRHSFIYDSGNHPLQPHMERIEVATSSESLPDVVEAFERYLLACGYRFEGHLELVNEVAADEQSHAE